MRKKAYMGWEDLFTGDNESFAKELGNGYDAFLQTDFQGGMPYDYNKYEDNAEWIFWVTTPNREWLAEPEYLGSMTFEDACLAADFMIEAYEGAIAEDSMRFAGKRRKRAYTDEQMKVLRDYFEDSERQHLVDVDEEDIIHSWETALDLVNATPGRWEWGFAMQVRGLCADSDYLMGWNNGINIGDERPEPLPEYFPGSGTWSDPDLADAYNAHIPEMYRLFDIAMSVGDVIDEEIEPNIYYYDMTEAEQKRYDELWDEYYSAEYDFCEEHQKAVDDLCAAAQKLLNDANYYWIDSANIDEYINEMAEEWIENGWVYFDED